MSYLHSNDILHRDLKPCKVFLDALLYPKLFDFGLSIKFHTEQSMTFQSTFGIKGSPTYSAPEVLNSEEYTKASDVYSFALLAYEIVTNKIPFSDLHDIRQIFNEIVINEARPVFDESTHSCYQQLIEKCWSQNQYERPSFDEIAYVLENDSSFITENVDENEYREYIQYIDEYHKTIKTKMKFFQLNLNKEKIKESINMNENEEEPSIKAKVKENEEEPNIKAKVKENEEEPNIKDKVKENEEESNIKAKVNENEEESIIEDKMNRNEYEPSIKDKMNDNKEESNIKNKAKVQSDYEQHGEIKSSTSKADIISRSVVSIINEKNSEYDIAYIEQLLETNQFKSLYDHLNHNYNFDQISSIFNHISQTKPFEIYSKLCEEGSKLNNAVALHKLSLLYIFKSKTKSNYDQARSFLNESIQQGFNLSYFTLARLLHEIYKEDDEAFHIAMEGSNKGNKYSKCLLGYFIAHGIGVKKDFQKGISIILESGAKDYYNRFATDIGIYYCHLSETNQCKEEAFKWFEIAYEMKKTNATVNNYGLCFLLGIHVDQNIEKAKEIFIDGANKGFVSSMYHLAFIYEKTDKQKSHDYYRKAANQGHIDSKIKLLNWLQ